MKDNKQSQRKPHQEVVKAWGIRKQIISQAGIIYPWINGAQIMGKPKKLLQRLQYERMKNDADIIFYKAVIRCHGENTRVSIENGEFSLNLAD